MNRTTAQSMSPEVAALLKTMNREPQKGNCLQSNSPPLIVLDADPPPSSQATKTQTVLTEKTPVGNLSKSLTERVILEATTQECSSMVHPTTVTTHHWETVPNNTQEAQ